MFRPSAINIDAHECRRREADREREENAQRELIEDAEWRIVGVVDGDTVKVQLTEGVVMGEDRYTVRLNGLDTPETRKPGVPVECGGLEATSTMLAVAFTAPTDTNGDGLLDAEGGEGVSVTLTTDHSQDLFDAFGRLLAYVDVAAGEGVPSRAGAGYDLGETVIRAGYSPAYVFEEDFERLDRFEAAEIAASSARLGVWGQCGGDFHSEQ